MRHLPLLFALASLMVLGCPVPPVPLDDDDNDDNGDDDDTGDDDTGDDDTGDDDTSPVDADGDGWPEDEDCDDSDPDLNLDDADGDGYDTCNGDCNDGNGAINLLATDMAGDGIDQNCDGIDGFDGDGDGYAAEFTFGDDCDDDDPAVYPGAPDPCDGIDQDCAGDLEDEVDVDGDGFLVCDGDCDDDDPAVNPGVQEVICDGLDNDCAPGTDDDPPTDADGDGYTICDDCDDTDADASPDLDETCDGIDNDCDGDVDEVCITESFLQEANGWADILFVVDNSCSMYEEQDQLGAYGADLLAAMDLLAIDYRIGLVTTDDQEFQGAVIDPSTPDAADEFAALAAVGTDGAWEEKGIELGFDALTLAEGQISPNDGFFREQAGLYVVFAGDEDDQSPGVLSDWLTAYGEFRFNPDHVVMHGFTGGVAGCSGLYGNADPAPVFDAAITATGGLSFEICDQDWSTPMEDIAVAADFLADTFALSQIPVPASIEVEVNGMPQPAGWTYDAGLNAVIFDPADVPSNGDTVDIAYAY